MENAFIFIGIGGLVWIFLDIMNRGKKPATSPPAEEKPEEAPPDSDFQRLFRAMQSGAGAGRATIAEIREVNRIARMYDAMKPADAPAFFNLSDEQIMAVIQKYKEGSAA